MPTLTRDAILALPAGSELDALVAEHVMGWRKLPAEPWTEAQARGERSRHRTRWATDNPYTFYLAVEGRDESGYPLPDLPHFSTDIAAAWQVVRWVESHDRTSWLLAPAGGDSYHFRIYHDGEGVLDAASYAPTECLAICKAALLALATA